jgi:hypothetical protein
MKVTEVIHTEAQWSRSAYLKLVEDKVVFDCSDDEYGPIEFPISILKEALEAHNKKAEHRDWLNRILKYKN